MTSFWQWQVREQAPDDDRWWRTREVPTNWEPLPGVVPTLSGEAADMMRELALAYGQMVRRPVRLVRFDEAEIQEHYDA